MKQEYPNMIVEISKVDDDDGGGDAIRWNSMEGRSVRLKGCRNKQLDGSPQLLNRVLCHGLFKHSSSGLPGQKSNINNKLRTERS